MAVYKFDRMEWAIEKATELGVAAIAPVIARRTEKHLAQAAEKRAERWRRIAREASQQARRSDVPLIHEPVDLAERVRAATGAARASCLPSRSAQPRCATRSRKPSMRRKRRCPRSRLPSVLKADGLPLRKLSSTPTAGAPCRLVRAFCVPRRRQSPRWRWLRRAWSDCAVSNRTEARRLATHVEKPARIGDVSAPTDARSAAADLRAPRRRSRQRWGSTRSASSIRLCREWAAARERCAAPDRARG